MSSTVYEYIANILPEENIHIGEPMSKHTTFRTGGEARLFLEIGTQEQLAAIIKLLQRIYAEYFILGNGSNLLVGDKGYQEVILQVGPKMSRISAEGTVLTAEAGAPLSQVAKSACEYGLSGLEFASGIPGTIGGAVAMNAGAYDGEMSQIVTKVKVMNVDGEIMELDNETMEFQYRSSVIRNRNFVVLEVQLQLQAGEKEQISKKMTEMSERRREKQPLEYPSAGSTFKRPEGHFAGQLIMESGMRGYRVGGAQVSEKHCGFIVNVGNATSADILEVIQAVQERVFDNFGVTLEMEVIRLGDF